MHNQGAFVLAIEREPTTFTGDPIYCLNYYFIVVCFDERKMEFNTE